MKIRSITSFAGAVAPAIVVAALLPAAALGQSAGAAAKPKPPAAKTWNVPRLADGHPDLQGMWNNNTLTPLQRPAELAGKPYFTEQEAAEYEKRMTAANNKDRRDTDAVQDLGKAYNDGWYDVGTKVVRGYRTSLIVDPPDGRIPPLTAEGKAKAAAIAEERRRKGPEPADSWEDRNLAERCITRGAPKLPGGYNNNFMIVQSPGTVAILQEMIHETRIIPVDGSAHLAQNIRSWMGDSRGRWEGDTLVVDTTNFDDRIRFNSFNCCGGAGGKLKITERFERVDAETIDYRSTVDDPETFTKPWTVALPWNRASGPIYEYACHEGNYGMEGILRGARALEAAAAAGKTK